MSVPGVLYEVGGGGGGIGGTPSDTYCWSGSDTSLGQLAQARSYMASERARLKHEQMRFQQEIAYAQARQAIACTPDADVKRVESSHTELRHHDLPDLYGPLLRETNARKNEEG